MEKINDKKFSFISLVIIIIAIGIVGIWIFYQATPSQQIKELQAVEVGEYEGQNLSSIGDFHENFIKGPQNVNINNYQLKISGLVANPQALAYADIISNFQSYKKVVTLNCVEGWSVDILWQGVLVKDIVKASQPSAAAKIVIFHAYDGYTTSFPVDYIMNNDILMAYKMNDVDLPPERGFPFQLVAEDKWGYKWIKWITAIEFSSDANYQGFWESRGYSNTGDLNQDYFSD